ncbi:tRNA (N(6)-L-threonylcarbamoyladenosine(37)-C(2))-methylthiotransferase MtaB, partial [Bacteroidota bacterium]
MSDNNSNKKVAFYTLGCKLNYSETSTISRDFEKRGYSKVNFSSKADIYVINTCSVTELADKKCRNAIRRAIKTSPNAKIIAFGCYAQLNPEIISKIEGVDLILGNHEKFKILDYLKQEK